MHRLSPLLLVPCLLLATACGGSGGGGGGGTEDLPPSDLFVHVAELATIVGNGTQIDHPTLNGDPTNRLMVTHVINPEGGTGVRNPHPIGVRYVGVWERWEVFNEDGAAMTPGAAFLVQIVEAPRAFLHTALPENVVENTTGLVLAGLDGDPSARFVVTQYAGAPDSPDYVENPSEIGVYYSGTHWRIFNQDRSPMPFGAHFFVMQPFTPRLGYAHEADPDSIGGFFGHRTYLSHAMLDGSPGMRFHVTSNWNPLSKTGVYNDHPIGLLYDAERGQWAIENVDGAPIAAASFNVVFP